MIENNCQWRTQEQGKVALCLKNMVSCVECKTIEISVESPPVNCYVASYGLNGSRCHDCNCCKGKEPDINKRLNNRLKYFNALLRSYKKTKFSGDPLKVVADRQENNERVIFAKKQINSIRTCINYQKRKGNLCQQ